MRLLVHQVAVAVALVAVRAVLVQVASAPLAVLGVLAPVLGDRLVVELGRVEAQFPRLAPRAIPPPHHRRPLAKGGWGFA
ncbi:MAG: hypothetical protein WCJ73_09390 [Actinomycetes bacterium]